MSHERHVGTLLFIVTIFWIIGFLFACIGDLGGDYASSDRFTYLKRQVPGESAGHSRTTHSGSIPRHVSGCDRLPSLCGLEGLQWLIKVENW